MVSRFAAPPASEEELAALFAEAERRGVNIGAALALAASPEEAVANIKARLAAEARPEVRQIRENVRARSLSDFLGDFTSAARDAFRRPEPPPDAGLLDRLLPGFRSMATPILPESVIELAPERFQPAARAIRELTSPLSLATLPIGGVKGALLGAGGFVGGSQAGSEIAGPKGELIGGVIGGVGVPLAPATGRAVARGGAKLAEEVGKTNVGNVLLPRAPERVVKPLIYDGLTPTEKRIFGVQHFGRDIEGARDYIYGPVDEATGLRTGNLISADDAQRIQQLEQEIGDIQFRRSAPADLSGAGHGGLRDLYDSGLLRTFDQAEQDPSTFKWHGKGLDEVFQSLPESEQNALPRFDSTGRDLNDTERLVVGLQQIRTTGAGASTSDISRARNEIDSILSKYAEPEPVTGPIAQAGFGGEMGPGQVARGAAEQTRMTQAPLSEIAASEADRIAKLQTTPAHLRATPEELRIRAQDPKPPAYLKDRAGIVILLSRPLGTLTDDEYRSLALLSQQEQFRLTNGPITQRFKAELDAARGPAISQEPAAGPPVAATPPFAPTGAVSQAAVASPPVATPPRSVLTPPSPPPRVPPTAVPPAKPPVPPAGTPPSQPPLMPTRPSGIEETLKQAKAIVERDRPGITSRLMDYVPGLKQIRHGIQNALDMPETMTAGWVGQGLAEGKVETSLQQARIAQLARLDAVFGKNASATRDFKPAGVAFNGSAEQAKYPYVGTLADIMERPALYDMSAEQRAAIAATHNERSLAFGGTKADYALDIGEHPVQPGGVHMPSVGVGEDDIEIAGSLENALRRGRAKTRIYPTLADRWAHDNKFRPETSVAKLFAADDGTLATFSGRKVLAEGLGGKTRLQVMQETHPQLAAKMDILQKKLGSLRATAARIGGQQAEAIDNFMQSPLDPADLATLQADLNPRVGANAVGRQGPNFGKDFKALKSEVAIVKAQIAALRPAWENANLKPYVFVQDHVYKYFPVKEARQVENLLKTSDSKMLPIIDNLRATAFGGDLSPVSIQSLTAWFSDPIGVSRFVAQGKGGLSQASVLADMNANPASWQRFTAATGINPLGGVEKEFSTGYLSHPKLGKVGKGWKEWNEALYRPITKLQKDIFDNSYDAAVKHGLGPEQAAAVAADDATKIIPRSNFRRFGQSTRDAARYRAALTSVSFLTQPVALMNDATKGLVKAGTRQTLTRSEIFAVRRVLTLVAATEAIAITSNVYHAQTHNLDTEQAVRDSLNPNSGKWMSLVLPNGARVGLGGPFRGIIRMIVPREIKGSPVPVPFGGLERYAKGKLGPAARIGYDELLNRDYYGKAIRTENFPINILQGIEYALEGSAPLTAGSAAQQLRKGESIGTVAQEAASQFAGTNLQPDDPAYAASLLWKKDVKPYFDIPANAKEAKDKGKPTRTKYRQQYPQVEAKLFISGDITSLSSATAKREVVRLMKENNIAVTDIDHLAPKNYESNDHARLRRYFEMAMGVPAAKWAKPGKGASLTPGLPAILR